MSLSTDYVDWKREDATRRMALALRGAMLSAIRDRGPIEAGAALGWLQLDRRVARGVHTSEAQAACVLLAADGLVRKVGPFGAEWEAVR